MTKWEKAKVFIAGVAVAILMMLLLGATGTNEIGRYQIAGSNGVYFAVLDTSSGRAQLFNAQITHGYWEYK